MEPALPKPHITVLVPNFIARAIGCLKIEQIEQSTFFFRFETVFGEAGKRLKLLVRRASYKQEVTVV